MSFDAMKINDLKEVAEYFGVDLEGIKGKPAIIKALDEDGITYDMYDKFSNAEKAEPDILPKTGKKSNPEGPTVLVRMERANPFYEIDGHVFTKEHPYVAMTENDAEFIFSTQEGFRMATPNEIREYYN
jgi:hypothetical protein